MSDHYPGTHVDFHTFQAHSAVAEIRDPMLDGPGHPVVADAALRYRLLGNALLGAASSVRHAGTLLQEAYQGAAAEGVQAHLRTLGAIGEVAEAQAQLSWQALTDQAEHVAAVRRDLAVLPDPGIFAADPTVPVGLAAEPEEAVRLAALYQHNTNINLSTAFAPFETPVAPQIGPAGVATGGGAAVGFGGTGPVGVNPAGGMPGDVGGPAAPVGPPGPAPSGPGVGGGTTGPAPGPVLGRGPGPGPGPGGRAPRSPFSPPATTPGRRGDPFVPGPRARPPHAPQGAVQPPAWQPGQPWIGRTPHRPTTPGYGAPVHSPDRGAYGRGPASDVHPGPARPGTPPAPGTGAGTGSGAGVGTGSGAGRQLGAGHVPLLPTAGGARQDGTHQRPPWLLEDDPESIWFAGMPAHVDPVIGGDLPDPGSR